MYIKLYHIGYMFDTYSIKFWDKKHARDANDTLHEFMLIHLLTRIDDTPCLLMLHTRFYAKRMMKS